MSLTEAFDALRLEIFAMAQSMLMSQVIGGAVLSAVILLPAALISWLSLFLIRRGAQQLGFVDQPTVRKDHARSTPLGGGLGIWAGIVAPLVVATWLRELIRAGRLPHPPLIALAPQHIDNHLANLNSLWLLVAVASILLGVGLWDDRRGVDWRIRLTLQVGVVVTCVAWPGSRVAVLFPIPWIASALAVIWMVALINAFNMLDNMDGLSAGVATIAGGVLAGVLLLMPSASEPSVPTCVSAFLLLLTGSLLGFLAHNLPPARIFMGDGGSYFVGFCLGAASLFVAAAGFTSETPHAILAPAFVMAVPIYDMASVILIRLRTGQSPFHADQNHLSHRLVKLGLTRWQAVLMIYLLTIMCGSAALVLPQVAPLGAAMLSLLVSCLLALTAMLEWSLHRRLRR